jgi:signal transduction histidine kinase
MRSLFELFTRSGRRGINCRHKSVEAVEGALSYRITSSWDEELTLPAKEDGLYRIAQEALNNALKHAQAQHRRLFQIRPSNYA